MPPFPSSSSPSHAMEARDTRARIANPRPRPKLRIPSDPASHPLSRSWEGQRSHTTLTAFPRSRFHRRSCILLFLSCFHSFSPVLSACVIVLPLVDLSPTTRDPWRKRLYCTVVQVGTHMQQPPRPYIDSRWRGCDVYENTRAGSFTPLDSERQANESGII